MCLDENILGRIKEYSEGKQQGPTVLELYPTWRCNSRCLACLIPEMQKNIPAEIPSQRYLEIIRQAAELNVYICYILGGGEPLCRPDLICDLVKNIKRYNMKGMLTTNGMAFPESLARNMVDMKWDFIHFSVDGPDKYIHDELRGIKGSFDNVMQTIRLLNLWKKRLSINKPSMEFNTVLSAKNYHVLSRLFQLAKNYFIDYITVIPVIIHTEKMQKLSLSNVPQDALLKSLRETKNMAVNLNINSNIDELLNNYFNRNNGNSVKFTAVEDNPVCNDRMPEKIADISNAYCLKPWYHLVIQANGEVGPCCNFQEDRCNIMNEGLKQIWFGNYFNNLRELMINNCPPVNCLNCNRTLQANANKQLVKKLKNLIN